MRRLVMFLSFGCVLLLWWGLRTSESLSTIDSTTGFDGVLKILAREIETLRAERETLRARQAAESETLRARLAAENEFLRARQAVENRAQAAENRALRKVQKEQFDALLDLQKEHYKLVREVRYEMSSFRETKSIVWFLDSAATLSKWVLPVTRFLHKMELRWLEIVHEEVDEEERIMF